MENKMMSFMEGKELTKKALFNVLDGGCDGLLNDIKGKTLEVVGIYYEGHDDAEGKMRYRTILFTADGKSYATGSNALKFKVDKIVDCFGQPTEWEEPLLVQVCEEETSKSNRPVLSLKVA